MYLRGLKNNVMYDLSLNHGFKEKKAIKDVIGTVGEICIWF